MLPSEDDAQTYMARFESMRGSSFQGKRTDNRRVMVAHKELERRRRVAVRLEESARRVEAAEARRERDRVQNRLGRIRTEQRRCKTEAGRRRDDMEAEDRAHAERRRAIVECREKLAVGALGETKLGRHEMLDRIAKLTVPAGVKQLLKAQFLSSPYLKSPTPPPQDPTPEDPTATPQSNPPLQDPNPPPQGHPPIPPPPPHDHPRLSVSSPTNSEPLYIETLHLINQL